MNVEKKELEAFAIALFSQRKKDRWSGPSIIYHNGDRLTTHERTYTYIKGTGFSGRPNTFVFDIGGIKKEDDLMKACSVAFEDFLDR